MQKWFIALVVIVIIAIMIFEIWCAFTYGNKPVSEIPFWVLWTIN
jgi:hypothetical protein